MKTARLTYLLLFILFISSCGDGNSNKIAEKASPIVQESYLPKWHPPQGPDGWFMIEIPAVKTHIKEIPEDKEELIIDVKRDTIHGIAVRAPGSIIIPEAPHKITSRDSDEEAYYSISYTSTNRYVGVNFENDIFNNTDYYYTNGIRIDYIAPIFAASPLAYPMLPYKKSSMNYHGMAIVQNMYTPTNPDTNMIQAGDRPFAAYLMMGHFKNTLSSKHRYRQYSQLDIGLVGPGSLGGFVQGQIHDIPPLGWENQIQNDLVLNYTALIEKGLFNSRSFDLNVFAEGQLGTLYTNAGAGMRIRLGKMNPYFSMPWLSTLKSTEGKDGLNWQYGIFANAQARLIGYNATLQGGVFNKSSNYTIPAEDIERFIFQASAGIFVSFKQLGIMIEQFYTSPQFKDAYHFRWGHINLTYCF